MSSRPVQSRKPALAVAALSAIIASGCSAHYLVSPPIAPADRSIPDRNITSHVVLVSIDGLRPDAIAATGAPTLQRVIREGSYTLAAQTILPSKTLPSHASMVTGEPPADHGVLWNTVTSAKQDKIELANIFSVSRSRGYLTAAFFSKPKFSPLQLPGTLDYSQAPGGWWGGWSTDRTVTDVERYLASAKPNVLFVHLADADVAGHRDGWMSDGYKRGVLAADAGVARLITAAERAFGRGNFTLIVTADHGGHDGNHGSDDPRDVTIPWIAWGRGVKASEIVTAVRTMDTASTVVWLLGLQVPEPWAGTPVVSAFDPTIVAGLTEAATRRGGR